MCFKKLLEYFYQKELKNYHQYDIITRKISRYYEEKPSHNFTRYSDEQVTALLQHKITQNKYVIKAT